MKIQAIHIILCSCLLLFVGFQEDPMDERIQEGIQIKIDRLKTEKRADCRLVAIEKAEAYIDSLVAFEVSKNRLQDFGIPERPIRPAADPRDSVAKLNLELEPIIKK